MDGLELVLKATREELWVEEGRTGARLELPLEFWRAVAEHLRNAAYSHHAAVIDQAIASFLARERVLSEKLACMDPAYDENVQARCQVLLAEDLRPKNSSS